MISRRREHDDLEASFSRKMHLEMNPKKKRVNPRPSRANGRSKGSMKRWTGQNRADARSFRTEMCRTHVAGVDFLTTNKNYGNRAGPYHVKMLMEIVVLVALPSDEKVCPHTDLEDLQYSTQTSFFFLSEPRQVSRIEDNYLVSSNHQLSKPTTHDASGTDWASQ